MLHAGRRRGGGHGLLAVALDRSRVAGRVAHRHLVAAVGGGLLELVGVHLLHLNALGLLIREAVGRVASRLDWQVMVVLRRMGGAAVVALGVSLARVRALLLDEDSFEGGARAAIRDHDLLGVVEDLGVVDSAGARVLLLLQLVLLHLLVSHVALPLVVYARRAFPLVMDPSALDRGRHCATLLRLALHRAGAAFGLQGARVRIRRGLVQTLEVVGGRLLAELVRTVVVVGVANDHAVVVRVVLRIGNSLAVHARQLQGLVGLGDAVGAGLNLPLLPVDAQHLGPINHN